MKVLVTGNKGYIGSVLMPILAGQGYDISGYDIGYFDECELTRAFSDYDHVVKDIRDVNADDVTGIDAIIHLAGLSNDPLGELSPGLTEEINHDGTIKLATLAKANGVKRFIFASSQSMYGISENDVELDEDNSLKSPVTAYAKTKWSAELELKKLDSDDFTTVCFRPSTVFGASPRLRCDIVFNNFVACAFTSKKIEIKSDGTPWRPVVHIKDVCNAFISGLVAPKDIVGGKSFNVGIPDGNFSVRDLAEAAQNSVPNSSLVFTGEHGSDSRTYRVSFRRILTELSDFYKPQWDLAAGGKELVELFNETSFTIDTFRGRLCNRVMQLQYLQSKGLVDERMHFVPQPRN